MYDAHIMEKHNPLNDLPCPYLNPLQIESLEVSLLHYVMQDLQTS